MRSFFFVLRHGFRWGAACLFVLLIVREITGIPHGWVFTVVFLGSIVVAIVEAFTHMRRVQLIADKLDAESLDSRHRRQIEMPFPAAEAFDMVDAAIRELPRVENVTSARDSLQVRARIVRTDPYLHGKDGPRRARGAGGARRNLVMATVTPAAAASSVTLVCEPEGGAWLDWFMVDGGTNLENINAISRSLMHRTAERRKGEEQAVRETAADKEIAEARLSVLQAQVEPHFLYNTLASAQLLTRSDPARADQMLGNLITYLRTSLPRTETALTTLGAELERASAYLEIMRIRMGERLATQVQVPEELKPVPMPSMMLQTLVENAIKHGLEPVQGGGTIWILARESDGKVAITVADDGRGFSEEGGGTGIGLRNVRERLKLAYGNSASFGIAANFPRGVAATITLPLAGPPPGSTNA